VEGPRRQSTLKMANSASVGFAGINVLGRAWVPLRVIEVKRLLPFQTLKVYESFRGVNESLRRFDIDAA
jgi:hypothetical protein